jgi:hypothetical protein
MTPRQIPEYAGDSGFPSATGIGKQQLIAGTKISAADFEDGQLPDLEIFNPRQRKALHGLNGHGKGQGDPRKQQGKLLHHLFSQRVDYSNLRGGIILALTANVQ